MRPSRTDAFWPVKKRATKQIRKEIPHDLFPRAEVDGLSSDFQ